MSTPDKDPGKRLYSNVRGIRNGIHSIYKTIQ